MEHSIKFSGQSLEVQHRLLLFVNTSFSSLALAPLPSPCETELYYLSSYDFDFFVPLFLLLLLCLRLCIIIITIINYYWLLLTRPHRSIVVWAETQKRWRSWETAVQGARYQMGSQVVRSKYIKEKTTWTLLGRFSNNKNDAFLLPWLPARPALGSVVSLTELGIRKSG